MVAAVELACSMKAHRKPLTARRKTGSGVVTSTAPRVPPSTIMAAVPWATSWMLPFSSKSPPIMPVSATAIPASVEKSGRRAGFPGGALAARWAGGAGLGAAAIGVVTLELRLENAHSLKEKRHVLESLKDRLRHKFNVAVAEIAYQELWQRAAVAAVTRSEKRVHAEKVLRAVEEEAAALLGSELTGATVEWLA